MTTQTGCGVCVGGVAKAAAGTTASKEAGRVGGSARPSGAWMGDGDVGEAGSRGREGSALVSTRRPRAAAPRVSASVESMRESVTRLRRPLRRRFGTGVSEKERRVES